MNTFVQDIRNHYLPRYKALGQIIGLNVGLYLILAALGLLAFLAGQWESFDKLLNYLRIPTDLSELVFRPWTIVTSVFFHHPLNVMHIAYNMLFLFWIGRIVQDMVNSRHVWAVFAMGALAGHIALLLLYNVLPVFNGEHTYANGASAGVSALIVGTATLVPNFMVNVLFVGPVRLKWVALLFVILDIAVLPSKDNMGGHLAHLGGAMLGYAYFHYLRRGVDFSAPFAGLFSGRNARDRSARSIRVSHRNAPSLTPQQEIDRLLDKIAAVGYDKLTAEEKKRLHDAGSGDTRI